MTQTESLILSNADVDEDEHDLPMISEESVKLVQKRWSLQFADTCKAPAAVPNGDLRKDWISLVALVDDHGDGSTSERVEYVHWDEVPINCVGHFRGRVLKVDDNLRVHYIMPGRKNKYTGIFKDILPNVDIQMYRTKVLAHLPQVSDDVGRVALLCKALMDLPSLDRDRSTTTCQTCGSGNNDSDSWHLEDCNLCSVRCHKCCMQLLPKVSQGELDLARAASASYAFASCLAARVHLCCVRCQGALVTEAD